MPEPRPQPGRRRLLLAGAAACGLAASTSLTRWRRGSLHSLLSPPQAMADSPFTIALGDPRNFDLRAAGAGIERKPVGIHFYKRDWPLDALGRVRYLQGSHSFDIPRVSDVMGTSDPGDPEQGIYAWNIGAFAMDGERVPHALARDRLFALFDDILRAGWRRYLMPTEPRLQGQEAIRYSLSKPGGYALDPALVPSLDQWMQINLHLPYWQFWADGVYMTVRVIDEPALRGSKGGGVYMFTIELESEAPYFWGYFRNVKDMKRWKELIPAKLASYSHLRPRAEAELRSQGYVIDETYRDPPILALGQTQPS